jgi:hypothetical protein
MRLRLTLAAIAATLSIASVSLADVVVVRERADGPASPYRTGAEVAGFAGAGYGVGVGARLGATLSPGLYLGGAFTYYTGNASFAGGELGYKFWPNLRWELRPYAFLGGAFRRVGDDGFGRRADEPDAVFAFQPGFIAAYHFGAAYIGVDGRAYVAPNPGALAVLGSFGVNM